MASRRLLLALVGILLVVETDVHAYGDPGSGTLLLQLLLAASIGVMFYVRRILEWARGLTRGKSSKAESPAGASHESAEPGEGEPS